MAVNWGGVIAIAVFYLLILVVGLWAGRKGKGTKGTEGVMLAGRNIGLVVGIFTMTGNPEHLTIFASTQGFSFIFPH